MPPSETARNSDVTHDPPLKPMAGAPDMNRGHLLLSFALAITATAGAEAPPSLFVDPSSRWVSIHDKDGTGAALEFTKEFAKSCPEVSISDRREGAAYSVVFQRNGYNSGNVQVCANGKLADSFVPGHTATFAKVVRRVCDISKPK